MGQPWLSHAETYDGSWICDVCYHYECCLKAGQNNPCDGVCEHRPKLITGIWSEYSPA
jgi:hypothetical protein